MRRRKGVQNKIHGTVEKTPRIDSFELALTHIWGWVMCGEDMIETYHDNDFCLLLPNSALEVDVALSRKPNGYGGQQLFFLCPACGTRCRYLYQIGKTFLCRKCAQLNYKSQQETRSGSMYFYGKGMNLVEKHLDVWPRFRPDGFVFCDYLPDRPKGMHESTYRKYLRRFLRYREKHTDRQLEDLRRIVGSTAWREILRIAGGDGKEAMT